MINIVEGWASLLFGANESLAASRADICKSCNMAKIGLHDAIIGDTIESIKGLVCGVCHCPLSAKLRARHSGCPLGKWN